MPNRRRDRPAIPNRRKAGRVVGCIAAIATLVYVPAFYHSYFGEKPRLKSSKAMSFWNFFFGGIIFGALWNTRLSQCRDGKKKGRGVAGTVAIVLAVLSLAMAAMSLGETCSFYSQGYAYDTTTDSWRSHDSTANSWTGDELSGTASTDESSAQSAIASTESDSTAARPTGRRVGRAHMTARRARGISTCCSIGMA